MGKTVVLNLVFEKNKNNRLTGDIMEEKLLWIDCTCFIEEEDFHRYTSLAVNCGYDGIMIREDQYEWCKRYPHQIKRLLFIKESIENNYNELYDKDNCIITSASIELLEQLSFTQFAKAIFVYISDKQTLMTAIHLSAVYPYVIVEYETPTNIPLELLLAYSQVNQSIICKKVKTVNDGWVATMVMESGCDGVMLEPDNLDDIINFNKIIKSINENVYLEEFEIMRTEHIGMGDRICVDTTSMLHEDEGMLLGSTSNGGILVSSETHYLPYMELRPFRINAGALHMYIWNIKNKTEYLSELRAGSQIMIINNKGESRRVSVGRIKMERRPILLVFAKSKDGIEVNVALQDDWHVRVIGKFGNALNCTELKQGDIVLGMTGHPGRHVGYEINETIIER